MRIWYDHEPTQIGKHIFGRCQEPDWTTDAQISCGAPNLLLLEPEIVDHKSKHLADDFKIVASIYPIHHPNNIQYTYRTPPLWPELTRLNTNCVKRNQNAIIAVMGNKYRHRRNILNSRIQEAIDNQLQLDLFGTPSWSITQYQGAIPPNQKRKYLQQYKYCYCPENSFYPNYITEKLPEAILAGCIPIVDHIQDTTRYPYFPWKFICTSIEQTKQINYDDYIQTVIECQDEIIEKHSASYMLDEIEQAAAVYT